MGSQARRMVDCALRCLALLLLGALLAGCRADGHPTPAPAPTTPCLAELCLYSTPQGADAFLNGQPVGHTPLRLTPMAGAYQVILQREGYAAHRMEVSLSCGESVGLAPVLLDVEPPVITLDPLPARVEQEHGLKVVARATDNGSVDSLALYLGEALLHRVAEPSLRINLDTRGLSPGVHQGRIVARDAAGNEASATFRFEIAPPTAHTPTPSSSPVAQLPTATQSLPTTAASPTPQARLPSPTSTPQPAVALTQDQVTLLVYDYERALYTDPERVGHPYPLLDHERVGPPVRRTYPAYVLRNEYLEVVVLPDLGGRIYQMRFLPTGQPLLYNSHVAKPTHWGPEDQGWWLALGGIEFALPVHEHGYLTAQPWKAEASRGADGSATVAVSILEQTRQIEARVEITLRPREAAIRLRTTLTNRSGRTQPLQYWVNAMLSPGRHGVSPGLRFALPTDTVVVHSSGDTALPPAGATLPWPQVAGRDLSRYGEWHNWLGAFAPQLRAPFLGVYDEETQLGLVHVFPPDVMRGAKIFGFGRDFDHSAYADDGAPYVELWGGLTPTFWDDTALSAGATLRWEEIWYVVAETGGLDFANAEASLYARREGEQLHLAATAPGEALWRMVVSQGDATLLDEACTARPDRPCRAALDVRNWEREVDVHILRPDGSTVLRYTVP